MPKWKNVGRFIRSADKHETLIAWTQNGWKSSDIVNAHNADLAKLNATIRKLRKRVKELEDNYAEDF